MYKKLAKEIFIYGIGTILPRLIMVVFNWVFTHTYTTAEFATFNDVVFIDTLFIQLLLFGFETSIFRFASNNPNKENVLKIAYSIVTLILILFCITAIFFHQAIADFRHYPRAEYVLMGIFIIVCDVYIALAKCTYRLQNKPLLFSLLNGFNMIIQALVLWVLLQSSFNTWAYTITDKTGFPLLTNLIASFAVFLWVLPNIIKGLKHGQFSFLLTKKMLYYGAPVAIASLSFLINESFDKIAMKTILGPATTGAYTACYKIATFMTLFEIAFRMGVEPFFFKQANQTNRNQIYSHILYIYCLLGCGMYIFIMANLDWLHQLIIADKSYLFALNIVPYILLANIFLGIYNNLSVWYKVTDKTYFGMFFSILGSGIMIFSCLFLIPFYKNEAFNYLIPAWATLFVYGVMAVLSYIFSRKYNPISYPITSIILIIISCTILSFFFYYTNYSILEKNLILIGFIILLGLTQYKFILKTIKKIT